MRYIRRHIIQLLQHDGYVLHGSFVQNAKHKADILYRWKHMYGPKFRHLLILEFKQPKLTSKQYRYEKRINGNRDAEE